MTKKEKKAGPISEKELHQMAVEAGMKSLIGSNPNLRQYAPLILNNIDYNKVDKFIQETEKKYHEENISYQDKNKVIYNEIANYVASGRALKETAIQTLFDEGKEGKLDRNVLEKIVSFFKPSKFEGTKYFEKASNAYSDMYDILSQNEFAQSELPELVDAAKSMKMYGFLETALKNFKAHGMMDDKTYKMLSKELHEKTAIKSEQGKRGLEEYILRKEEKEEPAYKVAASIIGFLGLMLMIFNLRITGAAIGEDATVTMGAFGVFMIFFALLLFTRPLKRNFKK